MSNHFYSKIIRYAALAMIIYSLIPLARSNTGLFIELVVVVAVLNVNDLIRYRLLTMQTMAHQLSFLFSLLCIGLIAFLQDSTGAEVYIIYLLVELIVIHKKLPIFLIVSHFAMVFSVEMLQFDFLHAVRHELISYALTLLTILLFRNLMIEKRHIEGLNLELRKSNRKLEVYTKKIERLTIIKERTRIAQELHDSMGHALVALNMNLEYAEKVVDQRPVEIKAVLGKTRELTKQSLTNLRQVVKLLKDDAVPDLDEALHKLIDAFRENNQVHFDLSLNVSDELMNSKIKSCLYKTVREGITNGFRHGGATLFAIAIASHEDKIIVNMTNNGVTDSEIVKSNGLKGIENRFRDLGGMVHFVASKESGFTIKGSLPMNGTA